MSSEKRKELSVAERKVILNLRNQGKSYTEVASVTQRSRATVQSVIMRFGDRETMQSKPRHGRPRKLTSAEEKFIRRTVRKEPDISLKELTQQIETSFGTLVHPSTVSRALHRTGFKSCVAVRKPYISDVNRKKRLKFAKEFVNEEINFWKKVLFSDESKYTIFDQTRKLVWRKKGEKYLTKNLKATVKHGGKGVLVWGCMAASGTGNLHFIRQIMTKYVYLDILRKNLNASVQKLQLPEGYYFQHDNDPKHTAYVVRQWILYNVPHLLQTPPQSPDINPIENLWAELGKKIHNFKISRQRELEDILQREWENISSDYTQKLIESMPRRLQAIIDAKGGPTKY